MKISFVRPNLGDWRSPDAMEPLAFAVLKGVTPPDVECELWDEKVEAVPAVLHTDLVALTVETYTARRAYALADRFRAQGLKVVAGGYHPTFLPEEALLHCDAVVCGDAEALWPRVLGDAATGRLERLYRQPAGGEMLGLRYDRSLFYKKSYGRVTPLQFSRGCRFACDFCSIHAFYGRSLKHRPIDEVVTEACSLRSRYLFVVDDNLFVNGQALHGLLAGLRGCGLRWGCQISLDVAADERLLRAMAESGCVAALIGFESLDGANLAQMRKKWNTRHPYREAIARFHAQGIMIYGSFIFGYDHDDHDVFARTVDFALENQLFLVNFSALTPTPASALYARLEKEDRLLYERWWLDGRYGYGDAVYRPRLLTAQQLTEGCRWARAQFYGCSNIAGRVLWPAAGCRSVSHRLISLGANWTSRRTLERKLGRPLG
ncbi:MAG: B12-binding domain-containing radical SAM protein [Candidatus Eremiobacteraeota bacterium]|nr:B12-binding domain-containing radical SAM protein [Candidatus Eremiobacteraeota bacterium]MCW5865787.1 B12-binding domain-containing radical SAM protein [Candidatus Eremiobacteraeota bacterium]